MTASSTSSPIHTSDPAGSVPATGKPQSPLAALLPTATISLSLFAPTIDAAWLLADFSRWQDVPMTKNADGNWSLPVELPDGDYHYKFKVKTKSWFYTPGQLVAIVDPRATRVDEATGTGILRIRNGKVGVDEYQWKHDANPLPANHQLIIYELHVGDFSGGEADPFERGKFKHVAEKLDYLADLGVNCLELLPIKEFPGNYAWGYTPQYLFAPESAYGPPEDLKALIDSVHARGMRIIFDGVYNHAHTDTPLAQIDHDYWFHHNPKDKAQSWGPQYNFEQTDSALGIMPARQFISENIQYWVGSYHIDGIRYDAARQIENFDALRMMSDAARQAAGNRPFINIAEYLPETPALVGPPDSGKPMDACWHDAFFWRIANDDLAENKFDVNQVKDALQPLRQGFTDCTQVVNYVSNHDHLRLMPHMAESLIFDEAAFARAKLAATLVMTAVGIPMIWMGEEFGDSHPRKTEPQKIDWTLLKNDCNRDLREHYKKVIALRRQNPALQGNNLDFLYEHADDGILAFLRWDDAGKKVIVIANLKDQPHDSVTIPSLPSGEWDDYLAGQRVSLKDKAWTGPLGPWQTVILTSAAN
jgi:1,4-alpha-glucan branching enzyme